MTKFEHSVVIKAPLPVVWDYVNEPANDPVWQGMVIEAHSTSGPEYGVGTEIDEVVKFLGRKFDITLEVTEHEPMRRSAVKASKGPVPLAGTYSFEEVDGGTRFVMTGETDAHGLFKLAEPVFAKLAHRELVTDCETLKDLLEAGASSGAR